MAALVAVDQPFTCMTYAWARTVVKCGHVSKCDFKVYCFVLTMLGNIKMSLLACVLLRN